MKTIVKNILVTAVAALTVSPFAIPQSNSNGFEQWYRAKYGRPSPTEQARIDAEKANTAYREVAPAPASPANTWFEQWYRAKYGRPSPTEQARLDAEQANTAYREVPTNADVLSGNARFEAWYRAKYGHSSPLDQSRSAR